MAVDELVFLAEVVTIDDHRCAAASEELRKELEQMLSRLWICCRGTYEVPVHDTDEKSSADDVTDQ